MGINIKSTIATVVALAVFVGLASYSFTSHREAGELKKEITQVKKINEESKQRIKDLEKQNKEINYKLHYANSNTQDQTKKAAIEFLQAFFTYDTSKSERGWTKVKNFTTENGLNSVKPAGEEPNSITPTEKDKTIIMKYKDAEVYINGVIDNPDKANVFTIVKYTTTINDTTSDGEMTFKLDLVKQNGKWLVDKVVPASSQER
ncbi:hypothetical protein PDQ79_23465 [Bacillus cereus]|nr:hypothetical protein [Bacillus cereus]